MNARGDLPPALSWRQLRKTWKEEGEGEGGRSLRTWTVSRRSFIAAIGDSGQQGQPGGSPQHRGRSLMEETSARVQTGERESPDESRRKQLARRLSLRKGSQWGQLMSVCSDPEGDTNSQDWIVCAPSYSVCGNKYGCGSSLHIALKADRWR